MPRRLLSRQVDRIHAFAVVPHAHPELTIIIPDFDFEMLRPGVPEGVAQRFGSNSVDFVAQHEMQTSYFAFNRDAKCRRPLVSRIGCEFFTQRIYSLCEV